MVPEGGGGVLNGDAVAAGTTVLGYLTLRTASQCVPGTRWRTGRGLLAALVGTGALVLLLTGELFPSALWMAAVPWAMAVVAFPRLSRARWVRVALWTCAAQVGVAGLLIVLISLGLGTLPALAAASAGLGLGSRWLAREAQRPWAVRVGLVRLRLWVAGAVLEVQALVDTGTRLQDPATGRPLVVVAAEALGVGWEQRGMHPRRIAVTTATGSAWLTVLPCSHAEVEVDGIWRTLPPLGVAVSARALALDGSFQALLPARLDPRSHRRGA